MNNKQLYLLWGIIIAFILVALFPPMSVTLAAHKYNNAGESIYVPVESGLTQWRFIFSKPKRFDHWKNYEYSANHIKVVAWTVEFIVLGVVAAGLWFTFGRKGDT